MCRKQFHLVSRGQQVLYFLPGKGILFFGLDGLERTALPELDSITEVKLQAFENLQAAHTERRREIRLVSPTRGPDGTRIQTRGFCSKLILFQQSYFVTVLDEVAGCCGTRDPTTDHEDFRLV